MNREEISGLGDKDNTASACNLERYAASYEMARMLLAIHDAFYISTPERFMDEVRSILDIETE